MAKIKNFFSKMNRFFNNMADAHFEVSQSLNHGMDHNNSIRVSEVERAIQRNTHHR